MHARFGQYGEHFPQLRRLTEHVDVDGAGGAKRSMDPERQGPTDGVVDAGSVERLAHATGSRCDVSVHRRDPGMPGGAVTMRPPIQLGEGRASSAPYAARREAAR